MNISKSKILSTIAATTLSVVLSLSSASASDRLPTHEELRDALRDVVGTEINGGSGFHFYAVVVDRDGVVRRVVFSGENRGDQFPIARAVVAAKASTVNGLSLSNFVVSTSQLTSVVQANGVFQDLQDVPKLNDVIYEGPARLYGTKRDPMIGHIVGGATSLGGAVALYNDDGEVIGGLGIGGESQPCADHVAVWIMRDRFGLDNLAPGIGGSPTGDDNIIHDLDENGVSASGLGTPECSPLSTELAARLPFDFPIGPELGAFNAGSPPLLGGSDDDDRDNDRDDD